MDIPFNEYKKFKNYQSYYIYYKTYIKMIINYKDKEIFKKDIYGEDKIKVEEIYYKECLSHKRDRRLKKLLGSFAEYEKFILEEYRRLLKK